jgi:hypothetical protein
MWYHLHLVAPAALVAQCETEAEYAVVADIVSGTLGACRARGVEDSESGAHAASFNSNGFCNDESACGWVELDVAAARRTSADRVRRRTAHLRHTRPAEAHGAGIAATAGRSEQLLTRLEADGTLERVHPHRKRGGGATESAPVGARLEWTSSGSRGAAVQTRNYNSVLEESVCEVLCGREIAGGVFRSKLRVLRSIVLCPPALLTLFPRLCCTVR